MVVHGSEAGWGNPKPDKVQSIRFWDCQNSVIVSLPNPLVSMTATCQVVPMRMKSHGKTVEKSGLLCPYSHSCCAGAAAIEPRMGVPMQLKSASKHASVGERQS